MSEYEKLLQDLERTVAEQKASGREMRKSLNANKARYFGNTRRRGANFGKPGVRHVSEQPIDLVKAETALRRLDQAGVLTKSQSAEAWRRLTNLRPVEVVLLK